MHTLAVCASYNVNLVQNWFLCLEPQVQHNIKYYSQLTNFKNKLHLFTCVRVHDYIATLYEANAHALHYMCYMQDNGYHGPVTEIS